MTINRILKKSIIHILKKIKNYSSYQLWGMQSTGKERSCSTVKSTHFCIQHIQSISCHLCISGSKSPFFMGREGWTEALSDRFRVNQKASNQVKNVGKSCKIPPRWSFSLSGNRHCKLAFEVLWNPVGLQPHKHYAEITSNLSARV